MKWLTSVAICITTVFLAGCEKLFIKPDPVDTPKQNFEILWKNIDENYASLALKNLDWDSVHTVYAPRISNNMNDRALFDVLGDMLNELKDGHVNITSDFDVSRYWDWYLDYPQNFDFSLLERKYLKDAYHITSGFTIYYKKFDSIGYMYIPGFNGKKPRVIDQVMDYFADTRGVIIDVRNNGGGNPEIAEKIAGRFTANKIKYGIWRWKSGPKKGQLSKPVPQYIEPLGKEQYTRPVIVLTNRSTFSAANDFVLAMSTLPHVTLVGDRTGGGGGVPLKKELPNGWNYRFSRTITLSTDRKNVDNGIKPDINTDMKQQDELKGKDTILEKALDLLS